MSRYTILSFALPVGVVATQTEGPLAACAMRLRRFAQPFLAIRAEQGVEAHSPGVPARVLEEMLKRGFVLKRYGHSLADVPPELQPFTVLAYHVRSESLRVIHVPSNDPQIAMMRARDIGTPVVALRGYHDMEASFIQLHAEPVHCAA